MTEQPSAGPEPNCTKEEEESVFEQTGACQLKKEAWEERRSQEIYAVWFMPKELKHTLLDSTLKRYGAVILHVTGTLTDASGKRVVAKRNITLLPTQSQPKPTAPKPSPPPSHKAKIEEAEREYCEKVLRGSSTGTTTIAGHIYLDCWIRRRETKPEEKVVVSESTIGGQ